MRVDWEAVLWSDALWAAGSVAVLAAFVGLILWLGARIAVVIAAGLLLLAAYLLGRAVAGGRERLTVPGGPMSEPERPA